MEVQEENSVFSVDAVKRLAGDSATGVLTTAEVTKNALPRRALSALVRKGELARVGRGIYLRPDSWEDELFLLQHRYGKGVFSHDTALCIHGFSDRLPERPHMTFPQGYHSVSLDGGALQVHRVLPRLLDLGVTTVRTVFGNEIRVYDLERTLCDMVKGNSNDIEILIPAFQRYARRAKKDINKLVSYSRLLRVGKKISNIMTILL